MINSVERAEITERTMSGLLPNSDEKPVLQMRVVDPKQPFALLTSNDSHAGFSNLTKLIVCLVTLARHIGTIFCLHPDQN